MDNKERKCWSCKRILIGKTKLGLCPECLNKYGSGVTTIGIMALALVGNALLRKNRK